jgi:hypothetical protein
LDLVSQLFVAILVKVSNVTSKPYLVIEFAGVLNCFDRVVITGTLPEICHAEADLKIEFTANHKAFRKEERIKAIIAERGEPPGLVHIFSAMEPCASYQPWHDKSTHQTYLKPRSGKCLHYDVYFIDEVFGRCYLRVPTWAPFRLQAYFNGPNWLARRLEQAAIDFEMAENAFISIADPKTRCSS